MPPPNNKIPADQAAEIAEAMAQLQRPSQWTSSGRSGLFVPEKHFIGADGQPATLQNTLLHPPVPNEWLEQFGLAITEADVLAQDADGDGFTNFDEWEGHSNPTDKDSHPPYAAKLKLRSFAREAFPLIFSSSVDDTYAINSINRRMPTQFLQIGEMVAGTKYKLAGYTEKYDTDKYGTNDRRLGVDPGTGRHAGPGDTRERETRHLARIGRELPLYLGGLGADFRGQERSGIFIETVAGDQV